MDDPPDPVIPDSGQTIGTDTTLSAREAAAALGVNERTIRRAIARGELRATKQGGTYQIGSNDLRRYRDRDAIPVAVYPAERREPSPLIAFPQQSFVPPPILPRKRSPLIGRERDVHAVCDLLTRYDVALVTLVGLGGIGKTRLAQEIAVILRSAFDDEVWFVDLSALVDPALVPLTIAGVLGIREVGMSSVVRRLSERMRHRDMLLVLDNFERLLPAAPIVAELLGACPRLTVLVTSRVPLHISEERQFPVAPLDIRGSAHGQSAIEARKYSAVQLFCDRASAARPYFVLTDANAPAVVAICLRLDGLPLAIELAAARSTVLSPQAILNRLEHRLPLLTGGPRDQPVRLQTMRDAIAWSYDLLGSTERRLFRRLAVFSGGWTQEAAAAVGGHDGGPFAGVLDILISLVNASLVYQTEEVDGEPRFGMLDTVREYGMEQLEAEGDLTEASDLHSRHFIAFAEENHPNRVRPGETQDDRLQRVEIERANIRSALVYMSEHGKPEDVLQMAGALAIFWHHRGHLRVGRRWLEWGLENTKTPVEALRCRAEGGLCVILWSQGDIRGADRACRMSLEIAERIEDEYHVANALHMLALVAYSEDRWIETKALMEQALAHWRAVGDVSVEAASLQLLSWAQSRLGNMQEAVEYAEQSLVICRLLGHSTGIAQGLSTLADVVRRDGDDRRALEAYREALSLWSGVDIRWWSVRALTGLAGIAVTYEQPEPAAMLIGVIDTRVSEEGAAGHPLVHPKSQSDYKVATETALRMLGPDRFEALRECGKTLSTGDLLVVANEITVPVVLGPPNDVLASSPDPDALTEREQGVLRLMAGGHTDRKIAEALFLSHRTVNAHVGHILSKLGASTRREAVVKARASGMLDSN